MKKFLVLLVLLTIPGQALALSPVFDDVNSSTDYRESIEWTAIQGITSGYGDGDWGPENCVARAELLKMIWEYQRIEKMIDDSENIEDVEIFFSDVSKNDWYWMYLQHGVSKGMIKGYPDGTFRPKICVNRVEAMKMAVIAIFPGEEINSSAPLYYDDKTIADMPSTVWYSRYARFLFMNRLVGTVHTQFVEDGNIANRSIMFFPDASMTRKEVAKMLHQIDLYL